MMTPNKRFRVAISATTAALGLVATMASLFGCAAVKPNIRIDYDRSADFGSYSSYAYVKVLGTDRAGYSTLVTTYFREAVDREMQARGYRFNENHPDLLVNFFADAREVTTVRSRPDAWIAYGYYGYRFGMYEVWPIYAEGRQTVRYKVGTANIDIVDARRQQLIWEGVAEGRLTSKAINDPRSAIHATVEDIFERYPGRARVNTTE